jgi:hypothetical protein
MSFTNDVVAGWTLVLVSPAILFLAALFVRQVTPPASPLTRTSERIVKWYASHPQLALWGLLFFLPLSAFVLGLVALLRTWEGNPQLRYWVSRTLEELPKHWPAMSIGGATLVSMGLLVMITAQIMNRRAHERRQS